MLGVQEYFNGKCVCALCGKAFDRLLAHVRQNHAINAEEYRKEYGFCKGFAFISFISAEKTRLKTLNYLKQHGKEELIAKGMKTRFNLERKQDHTMTPQRYLIIEENKSKRIIKPNRKCITCENFVSDRIHGKRCQGCYIKIMIKRNKGA